jgi:DNA-binding NarL/FixJ family response regulator
MTSTGSPRGRDATPLRVLVVDDQPAFRTTVELVLRHTEGFELAGSAESGEAAIELVASGIDIDLAIIDVHMPGIDGAVTAARLRELRGDLTAVLTSTYRRDELPPSVSASPFAYVAKAELDPERLRELWAGDQHRA